MAGPAEYQPDGVQLRAFLASDAFARALIGPVYAGRKSCCVQDILRRATMQRYGRQRHWRWLVVRPTRAEIERYAIPAVKRWVREGWWRQERGWRFAIEYTLGSDGVKRLLELDFLGMDDAGDRRRLAAGGATGVWLDEARNLSETVFEDAVRAAGTYPSPIDGGIAWSGVICSSRMPAPGHWLVIRPGEPGDLALFRQPGGRTEKAENLPALNRRKFSYAEFARERHPDWVRVNIDAELGASASETAAEEVRAGSRASLKRFVGTISPDLRPAAHHELLIGKLEDLAAGRIKRLMFFLPPGAAKSTYGSILFPPWYLGNNPAASVIGASHATELAMRFGRRVRNIVGSPPFRDIFGFGLSGDSGAAGRWETSRGGEYYAVGVDASVTGRRADLAIIDDPVKGFAEAQSLPIRQHAWDWYKADLWPRLKPNAALLYIGTRWHDDDLAGRLLEDAKTGGEQWEVVSLPAIAVAGREDPLGRVPGERLWPEWFTEAMLETAQREPRTWSALYQQEPMPESGDFFKSDWFRWYDSAPPRDELRTYGASDCAVSKDEGDFTVHLVAGVDPADDLYLLDLWRDRVSSDVWVDAQLDLIQLWKPLDWAEEKGQIAKGVGPFLTKRALERRVYVHRRQFPTVGDKAVRAQAIRGRTAQGKVYLPRRAPWAAGFVQELLRFPAGTHDDQLDAFALIGVMLDRLVPGSKPKPKEPIRCADQMTMDELLSLAGPGGRFGRSLGGGLQQRIQ
jgi:predicted phage terminase large subunit-like protein